MRTSQTFLGLLTIALVFSFTSLPGRAQGTVTQERACTGTAPDITGSDILHFSGHVTSLAQDVDLLIYTAPAGMDFLILDAYCNAADGDNNIRIFDGAGVNSAVPAYTWTNPVAVRFVPIRDSIILNNDAPGGEGAFQYRISGRLIPE